MNDLIRQDRYLLLIVFLPFLYLAFIWKSLPEKVPLHWDVNGEIDRYGDKLELAVISLGLPIFVYVLFLLIPFIDPKKKLQYMGQKYQTIKLILTTFMSVLSLYIIYIVKNQSYINPNYIYIIIGVLYVILGNFFQTIRANYFIGIRTPWTLENEQVWKDTHSLGGRIWFIGGMAVIVAGLLLSPQINFVVFLSITLVMAFIPIIYSYIRYKEIERDSF